MQSRSIALFAPAASYLNQEARKGKACLSEIVGEMQSGRVNGALFLFVYSFISSLESLIKILSMLLIIKCPFYLPL